MMTQLGQYVFSVSLSALVLGILRSVPDPKAASTKLIQFAGGIFLMFVLIQPVSQLDLVGFLDSVSSFSPEMEFDTDRAMDTARNSMAEIIIRETEAYILDKAQALGLTPEVFVTVSEDAIPVPKAVRIICSCGNGDMQRLQAIIEEDLGIPKEKQIWIQGN